MSSATQILERMFLIATILGCLLWPRSRVHAQGPARDLQTRFPIDDRDPEGKVPSHADAMKAPLEMGYWVMLVSDRAEAAIARRDHAAAVKYFRALAKAVPDRSVSYAKMCASYQALGAWREAVQACRTALGKKGVTAEDHARFVRLLLSKDGALDATEVADADAVIAHLGAELAKGSQDRAVSASRVEQLRCELALRLEDARRLRVCKTALARLAPGQARALVYDWALAMVERDLDRAQASLDAAGHLPADVRARMQRRIDAERDRQPGLGRVLQDPRAVVAAAGLLLIAGTIWVARRRTKASQGPLAGTQSSAQSVRSHSSTL